MKKIIIGIHGLGNKPPKDILEEWWKAAIIEGQKKFNYPSTDFRFEMFYWADVLNNEPLNPEETDKKNPLFVSERYLPEDERNFQQQTGIKQKAINYVEKYYDKFLVNEIISLKHPALTDIFIHFNLKEVEAYFSAGGKNNGEKSVVKELITGRLKDIIMRHRNEKILVIAHSMGAIIAHDALLDLEPGIKIDTLLTIGSPLGQQYILNFYDEEKDKKSVDKLMVPHSIKNAWYNFSDENDHVAINHHLGEVYKENADKLRVIDRLVKNNYSSQGVLNPHKSYGYLRTAEVADIVNSFLGRRKLSLFFWLKNKFI